MDTESCGHDDSIFKGSQRNKNSDAKKKHMIISRKRIRTKKRDEQGVNHVASKDQKAEERSESSKSSQEGAYEKKDIQSSDGYLESRCCTRKFVNLVSTFNSEKVENVRQLGLDGLLKIQCQTLKNQLILELANKFDVEQCELHVHGGRLKFTVKDNEKTLGLPSEGEDVGKNFWSVRRWYVAQSQNSSKRG